MQKPGFMVATKGVRRVGEVTLGERGTLIMMALAGNAPGKYHPPPISSFPEKSTCHILSDGVLKGQFVQPMAAAGCRKTTLWCTCVILFITQGQQMTTKSCSCWTTIPHTYLFRQSIFAVTMAWSCFHFHPTALTICSPLTRLCMGR